MIFQAMILIADLMFLSGNQYDYDPYYKVNFFSHDSFSLFFSTTHKHTHYPTTTPELGEETATEILNSLLFYELCVM